MLTRSTILSLPTRKNLEEETKQMHDPRCKFKLILQQNRVTKLTTNCGLTTPLWKNIRRISLLGAFQQRFFDSLSYSTVLSIIVRIFCNTTFEASSGFIDFSSWQRSIKVDTTSRKRKKKKKTEKKTFFLGMGGWAAKFLSQFPAERKLLVCRLTNLKRWLISLSSRTDEGTVTYSWLRGFLSHHVYWCRRPANVIPGGTKFAGHLHSRTATKSETPLRINKLHRNNNKHK